MSNIKILITCPPVISNIQNFKKLFHHLNISYTVPKFDQTMSLDELSFVLPGHDGWLIGDDPTSYELLLNAKNHGLKAAVKWGVGTDNIDYQAFATLDIPVRNTPNVFGNEVADLALGYLIDLSKNITYIDRKIRSGIWCKPSGKSIDALQIGVVGFGDIGRNLVKRLNLLGAKVVVYDPNYLFDESQDNFDLQVWPSKISYLDYLIICCSLNQSTKHMINEKILDQMKMGSKIINVSRGAIIDEEALIKNLESKKIAAVALDVFENEPLPLSSPIRNFEECVLGSHNASNTTEAVHRVTEIALKNLVEMIQGKPV